MINKAQATLEFTLIFVIMAALVMGLLGLWKWSNDNIVKRQLDYNTTRITAGSATPGAPEKWSGAAEINDNDRMNGAGSPRRTYFFN
jgi:hypothetical protein